MGAAEDLSRLGGAAARALRQGPGARGGGGVGWGGGVGRWGGAGGETLPADQVCGQQSWVRTGLGALSGYKAEAFLRV